MGRRRRQKKVIEGLEITEMVTEGKGMGRHEGMVVFVENAVPGDIADVQLQKKKKDYAIGNIQTLKTASELRTEAFCQHFGTCGGCKWQYLKYPDQLHFKDKIVKDTFTRIGKIQSEHFLPIIGADEEREQFYRNKMEFTFTNSRWLSQEEVDSGEEITHRNAVGFHVPKMFHKVVDVETCYLMAEPCDRIRNEIRKFALENDFTFYNIFEHKGLLRTLIIRNSIAGELMVVLSFGEEDEEKQEQILNHLEVKFPEITSLNFVVNLKKNDTLFDQNIICIKGRPYIEEYLEDLKFKISPKSFFQTNPYQALKLYKVIRDFANLEGNEIVYDLYTGTGSIAQFLARACKKVVGVEEVQDAIKDAKFNAKENKLDNCHFVVGDVKNEFNQAFVEAHGQADLLITDPPRAGLHADVVKNILNISPKRIIYVSCNPATQARDLALMMDQYSIEKVQPVDMFPHTYHIENVVLLNRK